MQRRGFLAPANQLVGLARHGGDNNGDIIAGINLPLHVLGDILDALDIGDGRAAELHDEAGTGCRHSSTRLRIDAGMTPRVEFPDRARIEGGGSSVNRAFRQTELPHA